MIENVIDAHSVGLDVVKKCGLDIIYRYSTLRDYCNGLWKDKHDSKRFDIKRSTCHWSWWYFEYHKRRKSLSWKRLSATLS